MRKILMFILCFVITTVAQENRVKFDFIPQGLHFKPLIASVDEARIGVLVYSENANLKVDIGNSIDILAFQLPNNNIIITAGIDFMAYALATNHSGLYLQIDALDGFFGGNISVSKSFNEKNIFGRFRIIHNSAHFVDGHYKLNEGTWINDLKPIPFTKDFGEILIGQEINSSESNYRYYASAIYSSKVRPLSIEKWSFSSGIEINYSKLFNQLFEKDVNIFTAAHLAIEGFPKYTGSVNVKTGVKFGTWNGKGVVFYLGFFTGNNVFSEYYYQRLRTYGIGFQVDFN